MFLEKCISGTVAMFRKLFSKFQGKSFFLVDFTRRKIQWRTQAGLTSQGGGKRILYFNNFKLTPPHVLNRLCVHSSAYVKPSLRSPMKTDFRKN